MEVAEERSFLWTRTSEHRLSCPAASPSGERGRRPRSNDLTRGLIWGKVHYFRCHNSQEVVQPPSVVEKFTSKSKDPFCPPKKDKKTLHTLAWHSRHCKAMGASTCVCRHSSVDRHRLPELPGSRAATIPATTGALQSCHRPPPAPAAAGAPQGSRAATVPQQPEPCRAVTVPPTTAARAPQGSSPGSPPVWTTPLQLQRR